MKQVIKKSYKYEIFFIIRSKMRFVDIIKKTKNNVIQRIIDRYPFEL